MKTGTRIIYFLVGISLFIFPSCAKKNSTEDPKADPNTEPQSVTLHINLPAGFRAKARHISFIQRQDDTGDERFGNSYQVTADLILECLNVGPEGVMTIKQEPQRIQVLSFNLWESVIYDSDQKYAEVPNEVKFFLYLWNRTYLLKIKSDGTIIALRFNKGSNIDTDIMGLYMDLANQWIPADTIENQQKINYLISNLRAIPFRLPKQSLRKDRTISLTYQDIIEIPGQMVETWKIKEIEKNMLTLKITRSGKINGNIPIEDSKTSMQCEYKETSQVQFNPSTGLFVWGRNYSKSQATYHDLHDTESKEIQRLFTIQEMWEVTELITAPP